MIHEKEKTPVTDIDSMIRAARGGTTISGSTPADMDAAIRHTAGRGPAPQRHEPGNDQATEAQLAAARASGIPDSAAHYLRGDSTETLRADAAVLNRAAAASGGWQDAPAPEVGFDGGVRGTGERGGMSMDDQFRNALNNRRLFGGEIPTDDQSHLHNR